MLSETRVLLVTNYREDYQFSMLKFGEILLNKNNAGQNLNIQEIYPSAVLGKWKFFGKLSKWSAYIDKFFFFPTRLIKYLNYEDRNVDLVHIADHSNSPYLQTIKKVSKAKRLLTCHDLIAVRASLGEFSSAPKTSSRGKKLQSWILNSITDANFYACDSNQTKEDLNRIAPHSNRNSQVIHLGTELSSKKTDCLIYPKTGFSFDPSTTRFILHVGSAAWYKNRKAVLRAFMHVKKHKNRDLKLILVGPSPQPHEIDFEIKKWIDSNSDNLISLQNVSECLLNTLYTHAETLVFPSFIEGFGWPPLEAASLGCPVIATKTGAIHDLLGENAKYVDPNCQESINISIGKGLENRQRKKHFVSLPSNQEFRENYYTLYKNLHY